MIEVAGSWLAAPDASTERLVRHGLRTLVKAGNPGALTLLGFAPAAREHLAITRRHSFKVITTRRYHPGEHAIELRVNGVASGRAVFELQAPPAWALSPLGGH